MMNRRVLIAALVAAGAEVALLDALHATPRQTLFGFVYARNSRLIRRIIIPDDDAYLLGVNDRLVSGERLRVLPLSYFPPDRRRVRHLQALIGPAMHSGRCCRVDEAGIVVAVVVADPEIDGGMFPGHRLIQHDRASVGWRWDGENFINPFRTPYTSEPTA